MDRSLYYHRYYSQPLNHNMLVIITNQDIDLTLINGELHWANKSMFSPGVIVMDVFRISRPSNYAIIYTYQDHCLCKNNSHQGTEMLCVVNTAIWM